MISKLHSSKDVMVLELAGDAVGVEECYMPISNFVIYVKLGVHIIYQIDYPTEAENWH